MSLYRSGAKWMLEFEFQGRRIRRKGFPNRALAEDAEKKLRRECEDHFHAAVYGLPSKASLMPWSTALARYQAETAHLDSAGLIHARMAWWAQWAQHCAGPDQLAYIQTLTEDQIKTGLTELETSPMLGRPGIRSARTRWHYLARLHAFFEVAIKEWKVMGGVNPAAAVKQYIKRNRLHRIRLFRPTILTDKADRQRLLLAADPLMQRLILVGMHTGLREDAVMRLTAEDFAVKPGWLQGWDRKPGLEPEPYWIPVAPILAKLVRELGIVKGRLWRTADGSLIRRFPRAAWVRACARAGFATTRPALRGGGVTTTPTTRYHDLRHLVGVTLTEAGVSTDIIRKFMHHASEEASQIYRRGVSDAAIRAAGETLAGALDH
jgi:integrase